MLKIRNEGLWKHGLLFFAKITWSIMKGCVIHDYNSNNDYLLVDSISDWMYRSIRSTQNRKETAGRSYMQNIKKTHISI